MIKQGAVRDGESELGGPRFGLRFWQGVTLGLLAWGALEGAFAHPERPNILLILSDDMGYSDIGAYGGEIRTPVLDQLCDEGWQFTQAYNAARCCPTRASLLTGLYPHQTGVGGMLFPTEHPGYSEHVADDSIQLAEILKAHGYGTYMTGKWHLAPRTHDAKRDIDYWPTRRGFDRFYGTIAGYGSFWDPATLYRDETALSAFNDTQYQPERYYYTDAITDHAIRFLKEHHEQESERPFFLYLSYTAAHWPLHAFPEDIAAYEGVYDTGYEAIHRERLSRLKRLRLIPEVGQLAALEADWDAVADKELETALMATYAAMITRMDAGIGQVLASLESLGALENTIVIYLQDNGSNAEDWFSGPTAYTEAAPVLSPEALQTATLPPMWTREGTPVQTGPAAEPGPPDGYLALKKGWANVSNTPFRKFKHYAHEGGISTPLIINWPAMGAPPPDQRIIRDPVHLIDIVPTCLEAAGASQPTIRKGVPVQPLEGVSLWSTLLSGTPLHRDNPLFWEHEGSRAVREGRWKLVAEDGGHWELYDMETDRGETENLALVYPHLTNRLTGAWLAWAERARVLPYGGWFDRQREQTLFLRQGESLPLHESPRLANHSITLQTNVLAGPCEGVVLAQGDDTNGYQLSLNGSTARLSVRGEGHIVQLEIDGVPPPPFKLIASIRKNGRLMLGIDDRRLYGELPGGITSPPLNGLSVGNTGNQHTDLANKVPFQGKLGVVNLRGKLP
jgi:arylsulfatase A-like enzyme